MSCEFKKNYYYFNSLISKATFWFWGSGVRRGKKKCWSVINLELSLILIEIKEFQWSLFLSMQDCVQNAKKHLTSKFTYKKRREQQGGGEDQKVNKALFCFSVLEMSRSHGHSKQLPATCTCHRRIRLLILGTACSESLSLTEIFTFDTGGVMGTSLRTLHCYGVMCCLILVVTFSVGSKHIHRDGGNIVCTS